MYFRFHQQRTTCGTIIAGLNTMSTEQRQIIFNNIIRDYKLDPVATIIACSDTHMIISDDLDTVIDISDTQFTTIDGHVWWLYRDIARIVPICIPMMTIHEYMSIINKQPLVDYLAKLVTIVKKHNFSLLNTTYAHGLGGYITTNMLINAVCFNQDQVNDKQTTKHYNTYYGDTFWLDSIQRLSENIDHYLKQLNNYDGNLNFVNTLVYITIYTDLEHAPNYIHNTIPTFKSITDTVSPTVSDTVSPTVSDTVSNTINYHNYNKITSSIQLYQRLFRKKPIISQPLAELMRQNQQKEKEFEELLNRKKQTDLEYDRLIASVHETNKMVCNQIARHQNKIMGRPENGEYIEYHPDGITPRCKCMYKNYMKDGKCTFYYSNGSIKTIGYFVLDKYHGRWIDYDMSAAGQCGKITSDFGWINNIREDWIRNQTQSEPQLEPQTVPQLETQLEPQTVTKKPNKQKQPQKEPKCNATKAIVVKSTQLESIFKFYDVNDCMRYDICIFDLDTYFDETGNDIPQQGNRLSGSEIIKSVRDTNKWHYNRIIIKSKNCTIISDPSSRIIARGTHVTQNHYNQNALIIAIIGNNMDHVRMILESGQIDINDKDTEGMSALHCAVRNNNLGMTRLLLDTKANIDVIDSFGNTPLHWSARWGDAEITRILLQSGASINVKNNEGNTALEWTLQSHLVDIPLLENFVQTLTTFGWYNLTAMEGLVLSRKKMASTQEILDIMDGNREWRQEWNTGIKSILATSAVERVKPQKKNKPIIVKPDVVVDPIDTMQYTEVIVKDLADNIVLAEINMTPEPVKRWYIKQTGDGRYDYFECVNDQVTLFCQYVNSFPNGDYKKYDDTGKLLVSGHHICGARDALWIEHNIEADVWTQYSMGKTVFCQTFKI